MGAISNFTFFDKCIKMGKNEICMGDILKKRGTRRMKL
jgi:hypothetical protein